MRNNKQLRRLGIALVALALIFGLMSATARERSEVTLAEKGIATLLYPFQVATDWVAGQFRGVGQTVQELTHLREENARLSAQVQEAAQVNARNVLLEQENQALRGELAIKQRSAYPLLSAQVIARSSDNWYRTVIIDKGSRDGVQTNMAVINWQGLVGKISSTTPFTSTVQLATDAGFGRSNFGAGSKLPNGELGIIETVQGGHLRMKFFISEPTVEIGQPVFTSGQAKLPPDLLIGYVESLNQGGSAYDRFVNIRPAVDFNKLEVVHVVMHLMDALEEAPKEAPKP